MIVAAVCDHKRKEAKEEKSNEIGRIVSDNKCKYYVCTYGRSQIIKKERERGRSDSMIIDFQGKFIHFEHQIKGNLVQIEMNQVHLD
jgi:hypothetical protein